MTKAGVRALGISTFALAAFLAAAGTGGAASNAPPVPRLVEPSADHGRFIRVAGLFGESDEEKQARFQHEADQDGQISSLNAKVRDLEDTVRSLRGENEELTHRVREFDAKVDKMAKDFEYRLCTIAAQQLGASPGGGDANAIPCNTSTGGGTPMSGTSGSYAPPPRNASNNGDSDLGTDVGGSDGAPPPRQLAPPPGVLGTLGPGESSGPPPRTNAMGSSDDSRNQFSNAMNLLAKARYDEASAAFRAFADTHPKDDLAPQAIYWVADIAYVQKDYGNAARTFAEVIKKYPTSSRAPDSMFKLGQSLIAGGQKKEGCTALAALPGKYPKAPKALLDRGADARKAACRGVA